VTFSRLIVAVVFLVVWGLITHGTFAGSGDEPHYLIIAQSIAFDGDLDLANNYAQPGNLIGAGHLQPEAHALPGRGGVLRPVHDVGMPLLFAPYVRIAYPLAQAIANVLPDTVLRATRLNAPLILRHLISLAMALVTGLLGVQLFSMFARVARSERQAMWWALLFVLSPPLLSHSFLFFTEIPSALIVTWLVNVLSDPRSEPLSPGVAAVVGVAIGGLLLIHVRNVALVAVFLAWTLMRFRRLSLSRQSWALFASGCVVVLIVRTAFVYTFWGTVLTTPIARPDLSMTALDAVRETGARMVGMLFSREYGLLPFAPVYVLAFAGLWTIRSLPLCGGRAIWVLVASYLATLLIPYSNPYGLAGGFAPASRMIVPIVPLLAVAAFACARGLPRVRWLLVGLQIAIDVYVWQWPKTLWSGQ
jgi:hypothetical protein